MIFKIFIFWNYTCSNRPNRFICKNDIIIFAYEPVWSIGTGIIPKTNDLAGDGTTTATVLAQAIVKEGLKNVAAGANPMDLKRGIDKAVDAITKDLEKQVAAIKKMIIKFWKLKNPKIIYGGSVNLKNIDELKKISSINGFLIGGASQNAKNFIDIIKKTIN